MSNDSSGLFGDSAKHPDRPDTPEFWRLSEVILGLDAAAASNPATALPDEMSKIIDINAVAYLAKDRADRVTDHFPPQMHTRVRVLAMALWMEGFLAGAQYQKEWGRG